MDAANSPLIDLAKARARFENDEELIREIFSVFISEAPERTEKIEAALSAGDLAQMVRLAHSLKGVAGTMFAEPLRLLALDTEMAARAAEKDRVCELGPKLVALLRLTSEYLQSLP